MAGYIERTEEIMLAMNAGAKAIENTRRYHGAVYIKDLSSENSQEIPYLLAAKVLREVSDAPAADVAPVVHGRWENGNPICPVCGEDKFKDLDADIWCDWQPDFCPNCGAKMDGGDNTER
nr:MAG TPA: DNA-directed RNA polymerase subunit [Caudoviricetes sp.]